MVFVLDVFRPWFLRHYWKFLASPGDERKQRVYEAVHGHFRDRCTPQQLGIYRDEYSRVGDRSTYGW
jgi:hypothetical protein